MIKALEYIFSNTEKLDDLEFRVKFGSALTWDSSIDIQKVDFRTWNGLIGIDQKLDVSAVISFDGVWEVPKNHTWTFSTNPDFRANFANELIVNGEIKSNASIGINQILVIDGNFQIGPDGLLILENDISLEIQDGILEAGPGQIIFPATRFNLYYSGQSSRNVGPEWPSTIEEAENYKDVVNNVEINGFYDDYLEFYIQVTLHST